ncbi:MAG: AAA family ATPase [Phycisphaerae bacterium]|nr:AAA family ATPase [Phycisphaerae bacterium]
MEMIIFIGLQASGKSTFYMNFFFNSHMRINLDMLRTRNREDKLLNYCIETQLPFVVDNTNPTKQDRIRYFDKIRSCGYSIIGYYFQSKIDECLKKNQQRTGRYKVSEVGIKSTYAKLELPTYAEGYEKLYYVKPLQGEGFEVMEWVDEI